METNVKEESGLKFEFSSESTVVKFDDTSFYRDYFNKFPGSKGVDFISVDKNTIVFIEVKNCVGDEGNCRWRIWPDNQKRETTHTTVHTEGNGAVSEESLVLGVVSVFSGSVRLFSVSFGFRLLTGGLPPLEPLLTLVS